MQSICTGRWRTVSGGRVREDGVQRRRLRRHLEGYGRSVQERSNQVDWRFKFLINLK
jgi:hypothetical protein